jgi:hypothetical protein
VTPSKLEQDRAAPVDRDFANGFLLAQKFTHDRERMLDFVESELFHSETLFLFRGVRTKMYSSWGEGSAPNLP